MTSPEARRRAIAAEEARLAQGEKERAVPSTRATRRPERSFSSGWLSLSERVQAASEIPFEVDLVEKIPFPKGGKEPRGQ